jgi:hypothetical protein
LVEQRTENPRVGSSILPLGTIFPLPDIPFNVSSFPAVSLIPFAGFAKLTEPKSSS